ncbi:MAG TPA: creatininase family protein, partial [Candidatus Eisenbacteria bacterium]|nr:creatininase family protein [Candidatus Eisenbacteria bacterium]
MTVRELGDLTWEETRDLDRARAIAILPVGAIEAHGPHLPLATDVIIATAMAREGGALIGARGLHAVLLPALPFTAAPFGAAFAGTLSVQPSTVTALLLDLARELTRHGFAALAVANGHLDPAHLGALLAAESKAREDRLLPIVCPNLTRKPWAARLSEEFKSGACHAGRYEGSVVMAERADLVREDVRRALPANPASLSTAIRDGKRTFEEAGGARAYFGWPADATAEEGRATVAALGSI